MTHEELLAELDELDHSCSVVGITVSALRAVVELCNFLDKKGHCCVPIKEIIQAIEKELE